MFGVGGVGVGGVGVGVVGVGVDVGVDVCVVCFFAGGVITNNI